MSILCDWLRVQHVLFCLCMCFLYTRSICVCRYQTKKITIAKEAWILSITVILTEAIETSTRAEKLYSSSQPNPPFASKTNKLRIRKGKAMICQENPPPDATERQFVNVQISAIHRFTFVWSHFFQLY